MSSVLVALGTVLALAVTGFVWVWRTAAPLPHDPPEPQVMKVEVSVTAPKTETGSQYVGSGTFTLNAR